MTPSHPAVPTQEEAQETLAFRSFKFRLLPTKQQHKALARICDEQRVLYNAALEERISCYEKTGNGRSYFDQCKALTELRKDEPYRNVPVSVQRWTLKRIDDAYAGFFRRCKSGEKPGFPRFRGKGWWSTFGFKDKDGLRFDGKRIRFKGLPSGLRVHRHRPMPDDAIIKSCTFKRDKQGWTVCFRCAILVIARVDTSSAVGIDIGLASFATLSNGEAIPNPRIARRHEQEIRRRSRALARCRRGSNRGGKVRARLSRSHAKISNTRQTFLHQQSARLAQSYNLIAVEKLQIKNMVRSNLARSIHDAGWATFINMLEYKAESAGGQVIRVNPKNTSQACSGCGEIVKKSLSVRTHSCPSCGLVMDRDENAALNILNRAVMGPEFAKPLATAA